jgi:protein phosphatase
MDLDCHGLSHVGRVRRDNEDHFAIMALHKAVELLHTNLADAGVLDRLSRPEAHVFVAADGVGGVAGGEKASGLAVGSLVEYMAEAVSCYQGFDAEREHEFVDQLTAAVERAHRRIQETYGGDHGPATTLTMVTLVWPRAYVVHVGDSRGYLLRGGRLRQFTTDQTIGDAVVATGTVTEQQAKQMGLYNILASAVGGDLAPAIGLLDLEPGDALLLCTDGLTKHVPDERIAALLAAAPDAQSACRSLVDEALERGGTDNITVIVARTAPRAGTSGGAGQRA